mmetsp:Transcript_28302/g.21151  ORF Transcript_28302/g.21151 Transcript_28302/m.21151 type:complete len:260 (+) Transcript_28302:853-1632(+)
MEINDLKELTKKLKCTLNDLLLSLYIKSLSDIKCSALPDKKKVVIFILQGTRLQIKRFEDFVPGNEFNTLAVTYTYGSNFREVLSNVRYTTNWFKRAYLDFVSQYMIVSVSLLPTCMFEGFKYYTGSGSEPIIGSTNVAGPYKPYKWGDCFSKRIYFVSVRGNVPIISLHIVSHADKITFGVLCSNVKQESKQVVDKMTENLQDLIQKTLESDAQSNSLGASKDSTKSKMSYHPSKEHESLNPGVIDQLKELGSNGSQK